MNKESIARDINCKDNLVRTIGVDCKLDLKEGQLYDNLGKIESWSGSNCSQSFEIELEHEYEYIFFCNNVPCHQVNYENEEECEVLGATDCESEGECLVLPSVKMRITDVGSDEDLKELGYIPVTLELVEE